MRRYVLRKGDKSSNGIVTQGMEDCIDHGVPITYIGAEVWCNGCKTVGHIGAKGPHNLSFMHGKQEALDGDICLCKCTPPPVIHASQDHSYHSFEPHELAAMGYGEFGQSLASTASTTNVLSSDSENTVFDQVFIIRNNQTNKPIPNMEYRLTLPDGTTVDGITDDQGMTKRIAAASAKNVQIEVYI